ncbi:uncharacterized protein [Periplaneta americana]|uniref:uncharacterized protein n=1 Tax=Periplaneta americana TaxID=6978 RepID=UPI0037E74A5B
MKLFTAVAFISVMACILEISEGGLRNYVLLPTRLSDVTCNKDYIEISKLKVQKFNKTMSVVKGTFILKKDFPETSNCSVMSYQNVGGGKYGKGPVDLTPTKCCDFFENDKTIWPAVLKATNVPIKCPLKKGTYELKNFDINVANLPDTLPPPNEWMMELTATMEDKSVLFSIQGYGEIKRSVNPLGR